MNLVGKTFRAMSNSKNGHSDTDTEMRFTSDDGIVEGVYSGGNIKIGHVLAKRSGEFTMDMLYHGATKSGAHNAGTAQATFSQDNEGRIRMALDWQWLTGDQSKAPSHWMVIDDAS